MGRSRSAAYKIFVALDRSTRRWVRLEIHSKESRVEHQFGKDFITMRKLIQIQENLYAFCSWQVQHITTATLVWLWSRHDLRRGLVPIVVGMLVLTVYRPLMLDFFSSFLLTGPWSTLIIKAITTFFIGATTLHIYAGLAHSIGIF